MDEINDSTICKSFEHAKREKPDEIDQLIEKILPVLNHIDATARDNIIMEFYRDSRSIVPIDFQDLRKHRFKDTGTITKEAWNTLKAARDTLAETMERNPFLASELHDAGVFRKVSAATTALNKIKDNKLYKSFKNAKDAIVWNMYESTYRLLRALEYINEEQVYNIIGEFRDDCGTRQKMTATATN